MAATARRLRRLIGFGAITFTGFVEFAATIAWRRNRAVRAQRQARWLQRQCQRLARLLDLRICVSGSRGETPLLVCNHVSYLDIIALGAVMPMRFVAKSEVRAWPWLGWLARCAGTIFLRRQRGRSLLATRDQMREAVHQRTRITMFPEGTSTDGKTVLPFHSSLLAVPAEQSWPVTPAWIGYELPGGDPAQEVCWWGDMTLWPHLWNLLGHTEIRATIRFGRAVQPSERRALAAQLHRAVCVLAEPTQAAHRPLPIFAEPQLLNT